MLRVSSFPAPASPLDFWRAAHPRPRHGFVLGSSAGTTSDRIVYLSLAEPARLISAPAERARAVLAETVRRPDRRDSFPRFVGVLGFDAGRGFDSALKRLPPRGRSEFPSVLF